MITTIIIAVLLAIIRPFITPGKPTSVDIYKDLAHFFVGGLFVAAILQGHAWQWWVFGLLTAWEVIVAVGSRIKK
jgi:hypothetical protein